VLVRLESRCQLHRKRNVAQTEIPGVVERFLAIGEDPEKFRAFLSAAVRQCRSLAPTPV
jgi:hypothetical protein